MKQLAEDIEELEILINNRRLIETKKKLSELRKKMEKYEEKYFQLLEFYQEIKRLVRNSGRSVITIPEIDELLIKYGQQNEIFTI